LLNVQSRGESATAHRSAAGDPLIFRQDPLGWIDAQLALGKNLFWMPGNQLCVADAAAARQVLWNREQLYTESSDFFDTRAGTLQPRELQIEVANRSRALIEAHLAQAEPIGERLRAMERRTLWPAAGNALFYALFEPVICSAARPSRVRDTVRSTILRRILRGPAPSGPVRRALNRFRLYRTIVDQREARDVPDLLGVVSECLGEAASSELVMEIYIAFVFAMVGSLGFALAWSLFLAHTHEELDHDPSHILSEALRLYPVAWLLGRSPRVEHAVLGERVRLGDQVVVSPYAIQRNPRHWEDAGLFRPKRWRRHVDRTAWLPFGAGPHACVAAPLTFRLVGEALTQIWAFDRRRVEPLEARGPLAASLAPPRFVLEWTAAGD
jgi:hypothetical protein